MIKVGVIVAAGAAEMCIEICLWSDADSCVTPVLSSVQPVVLTAARQERFLNGLQAGGGF